jgi:microcystin-dependent protein
MLLLTSTTDALQIVTSAAAALSVHASWVDTNTSTGAVTPGRTNSSIAAAATTSVAGSPASGVQRNVKTLHIRNNDASLVDNITVQHTDGTNVAQLYKRAMNPGDILEYTDQAGFGSPTSTSWTTGDVKTTFKAAADPGWVLMQDGSIGNAASGGTTRANNDTQNLFTLLWTNITSLLVQDSTGATVARGASAVADFTANRRLVMPKALGRALAAAGTGAGFTAHALGDSLGAETHAQTVAEMVAHTHGVNDPTHQHLGYHNMVTFDIGGGFALAGGPDVSSNWNPAVQPASTGISIQSAGSGTAFTIMQPTTYVNYMIKL